MTDVEDVIKINVDEKDSMADLVHNVLKCLSRIPEAMWHPDELIKSRGMMGTVL